MNINKEYIESILAKDLRLDNRKPKDYRKITIETDISPKSALGSARVRIGDTEVIAGVKMDAGEPYPDTPDEGAMIVNAELLPLASPKFESGPPSVDAIELSRVVDRAIRESKAIDTKKLCIKEGEKVWLVFIDIYPINDSGNLFDAAYLAAITALKNTKMLKYDTKEDKVIYEKTNKSLPLLNIPVECTIVKINNVFLVDPTYEEEEAMDARLTVAVLEDNSICAMQKGGDQPLTPEEVLKMIDLAIEKAKELRKKL